MKAHEAPRGTYLSMDKLQIQCLGNNQFICAMEGEQMKRGELPNLTLTPSSRESFMNAVNKANHNNDWFSLLLKEAVQKELE